MRLEDKKIILSRPLVGTYLFIEKLETHTITFTKIVIHSNLFTYKVCKGFLKML